MNKFDINKVENIVNEFIKKIYELDKSQKTLEDKLTSIDVLLDNLIDYCIKKKIFYYVENKIGYTNITDNFKSHLIKFIKNLIDPSDNIINKYIINSNSINNSNQINTNQENNWDNVSDINSLMFRNFKKLNESFEKNVSFNDNLQMTNYDDSNDGFEFNVKSSQNKLSNTNSFNINSNLLKLAENNTKYPDIKNLSLFIKILVNQNKYLVEFINELTHMCNILSDPDVRYKKSNPFD